jgi:hypothetical protein
VTLKWDVPYSHFLRNNHFSCTPPTNFQCIGRPGSGGGNHPTPIFQMRQPLT